MYFETRVDESNANRTEQTGCGEVQGEPNMKVNLKRERAVQSSATVSSSAHAMSFGSSIGSSLTSSHTCCLSSLVFDNIPA